MWKMLVAFGVFAAIVIFVLLKTDAEIDMGGERHGVDATATHDAPQVPAPTTSAAVAPPAQTASPAAMAASDAASAASR